MTYVTSSARGPTQPAVDGLGQRGNGVARLSGTMPPSHPRPEDLAALWSAMSSTAEHAAAAGEALLDHMVTVGDHATQSAVDGAVDAAVDALREISASCREGALGIGAALPRSAGTRQVDDAIRAPRVRPQR